MLTYNVKAAKELQTRLDEAVGPATRSRMTVSNFHAFCNRILTESAADAGLPPNPDVLDGVRQVLLLRDLRPQLPLIYHAGPWWLAQIVQFINRAKDELVTPTDFDAFVAAERSIFEERYGPYDEAERRLEQQGNLAPLRAVRKDYAKIRQHERAEAAGQEPTAYDASAADKTADREARRTVSGMGRALFRGQFDPADHAQIDELRGDVRRRRRRARGHAPDRARDRLPRLPGRARAPRRARLRRADRGGHPAVQGPPERPASLAAPVPLHPGRRVPGRQRRPDRAHRDARPDARPPRQRDGRRRRRPVDLPLPRRQLRRLHRVRHALLAPADPRPDRPTARPAAAPPDRAELPLDRRHPGQRQPPDRPQPGPLRARQAPPDRARGRRARPAHRLCRPRGRGRRHRRRDPHARRRRRGRRRERWRRAARRGRHPQAALVGRRDPLSQAQAPRRDRRPAARRGHPVHGGRRAVAVRGARDPRPRAVPPGDRRRLGRRRPDPDDDRRPVAARRARDPPRRADGQVRPAPPRRRDPRDRRHRRAQGGQAHGRPDRRGRHDRRGRRRRGRPDRRRRPRPPTPRPPPSPTPTPTPPPSPPPSRPTPGPSSGACSGSSRSSPR